MASLIPYACNETVLHTNLHCLLETCFRYSIASSRYGDDMSGLTASLCVRRATYWDPEMGKEDPAKKGICSNYLCDATPGLEVKMTGPSGKVMLLPEEDPNTDYIMVATGTGIAPFRGFMRRLFLERTPAAKAYRGLAWLFLGVANTDALLYDEEWQSILLKYPQNFKVDYALSREQLNAQGGKMYIQDKVSTLVLLVAKTALCRSKYTRMRSFLGWRLGPICISVASKA